MFHLKKKISWKFSFGLLNGNYIILGINYNNKIYRTITINYGVRENCMENLFVKQHNTYDMTVYLNTKSTKYHPNKMGQSSYQPQILFQLFL